MNNLVPAPAANVAPLSQLEWMGVTSHLSHSTPLERFGAMAYRQRWLAIAVFVFVVLIGAILTYNMAPRYTAVASVQLDQQTPRVISAPDLDPQPAAADADRFLQTELDRVRSRSMAEAVATRVNAEKSPAILKALDIPVETPAADRREFAIEELQQNVQAALGLNTRLAQIRFTSLDPVVSARVANAYADALTEANLDSKISTSNKAKEYLLGQLDQAKAKLENSERRMLNYARSKDLTMTITPQTQADGNASLRSQQVGTMTDSLSQAIARRIDAQQQWAQVSGTPALELPDVQNNKAIQDLYAEKAEQQAKLEEDRQRYTDDYPSVREAEAKIKQLDGEIGSLASNIKSSFYGRYVAARKQESQLSGTVAGLRGSAMAERERSVGFNSLGREVETNKAFYDGLLQRFKEVAAASGAPAANVTLVDRAVPPLQSSSPDVARNLALAGIVGLILALMAGAAREGMHRFVRSPEDVEEALNVPALGVVPVEAGQTATDFRLTNWRSAQAEAYNSIAVALEHASPGGLPKTLLITSSSPSEGKSTTSVGIARSLTAMGKHVLLIDGDLRHPSLRDFTGYSGAGFSDVLTGTATPAQIIQRNGEDEFDIVPAGQGRGSPISLLSRPKMQDVLAQLSSKYDIVIIDGPPVMGLADAVLLARSVESILVVVEANRLHRSEVDAALSRLPADVIVGSVVTKFNAKAAGVHYGGTGYYSY